jgi:transcriptional regulator of aromatic amino acid metabolism
MKSIISYGGSVRRILSKSEKRILRAIVESKGPLNVSELCKRAKVTPKVYYRLTSRGFRFPPLSTAYPGDSYDYRESAPRVGQTC